EDSHDGTRFAENHEPAVPIDDAELDRYLVDQASPIGFREQLPRLELVWTPLAACRSGPSRFLLCHGDVSGPVLEVDPAFASSGVPPAGAAPAARDEGRVGAAPAGLT